MSIQNKINNARPTSWPAEGLPRWWVRFIVWREKRKVRRYLRNRDKIFKKIDKLYDKFYKKGIVEDWDLNLGGCDKND